MLDGKSDLTSSTWKSNSRKYSDAKSQIRTLWFGCMISASYLARKLNKVGSDQYTSLIGSLRVFDNEHLLGALPNFG